MGVGRESGREREILRPPILWAKQGEGPPGEESRPPSAPKGFSAGEGPPASAALQARGWRLPENGRNPSQSSVGMLASCPAAGLNRLLAGSPSLIGTSASASAAPERVARLGLLLVPSPEEVPLVKVSGGLFGLL